MTRVVERDSGAQVLPYVADEWSTVPAYVAFTVTSADLRAKSPAHMAAAGRLVIEP